MMLMMFDPNPDSANANDALRRSFGPLRPDWTSALSRATSPVARLLDQVFDRIEKD